MSIWQGRFLGLTQLPEDLSSLELEGFFRLSPKDIAAIKSTFKLNRWVAVALQVGFFRFSGTRLDKYNVAPPGLLRFLGDQFDVPAPTIASLQALYKNKSTTRKTHQGWAADWIGIRTPTDKQDDKLFRVVREASKGTTSIDRLIEIAQVWLYERQFLIPAYSTVRDLCVRAAGETEAFIYQAICKSSTAEQRTNWKAALLSEHKGGRTTLEWLQQAPKKRGQKNLLDLGDKIEWLNSQGVDKLDLSTVPHERLCAYARDFQHRRPSKVKVLREVNLALQMVSFLKIALAEAHDVMVQLIGKKTSDLVSHASQTVQKNEATEIASYRSALRDILSLANDAKVEAEDRLTQIRTIGDSLGVTMFPSRAAAVRSQLTEKNPAVRKLLKELAKLDIKANDGDRTISNLEALKAVYASERTELPEGAYDCAKPWAPLVNEEEDRGRALRALEFATLTDLRRGFRRGSCWIDQAATYRDREQLLIPTKAWERERSRHYELLQLPKNPDDYLNPLIKEAEEGLRAVAAALERKEFSIESGEVSLPAIVPEAELPEVVEARRLLTKEIGTIQQPMLLLEMDLATRFSRQILGRPPASSEEILLVYAGLMGHGSENRAKGLSLMIPGLKETDISAMMQSMQYDNAIDRANRVVLQFLNHLPISKLQGVGKWASSDMMSVRTSRHLWNTRLDPRKGDPSIGMYTTVLDFYGIGRHQPIVLGERQTGVALEGVIRMEDFDVEVLAVDTHGYSDAAMFFSHAKHFDLCPRLKNLSQRRLCVPRGTEVPEILKDIVDCNLNLDFVRQEWDSLVRVVASMSNGTMSAVTALQRFGSAAQGDPIYRGAQHAGRLLRTNYLCDYFTKPPFRREIHRILNRGEHVHNLQHAIYSGAVPHERSRRKDDLFAMSAALTLLTNLAIAWTAYQMQIASMRLESQGIKFAPEIWPHISPASYGRINFKGEFNFPMDRYAGRLMVDHPKSEPVRLRR